MNNQQHEIAKRRALAVLVAPEYAVNPKVAVVLLAGSVARGLAAARAVFNERRVVGDDDAI